MRKILKLIMKESIKDSDFIIYIKTDRGPLYVIDNNTTAYEKEKALKFPTEQEAEEFKKEFIKNTKNDESQSDKFIVARINESVVLRDAAAKSIEEDSYISINDGKEIEPDYLIQDVTELKDIDDSEVEAPSIDGLLSLVNESLDAKYGTDWGYMKAKSISKKESIQYAIVDIVTPSILKEAEENKIKDKAVSKTVILESVPNSKMTNLKVNTLAGNTRFSQKTYQPSKVFARWLESEYLYDEMVKKFQEKIEARQAELKDSTEAFLKEHPELVNRVNTIKAQINIMKKGDIFDESLPQIQDLVYGLVAEFPHNTNVKGNDKNEYEQNFDTDDELVKILFGADLVRKTSKEDKDLADKNKKTLKGSSLKEGYESFNIGDIEGVFNPSTSEAMYSIPSKNIKDKRINLTKIPSTNTPYDTDTIIKDYIEKNYGVVKSDKTEVTQQKEEPEKEPIDAEPEVNLNEDNEDTNNIEENPENTEDVKSETGSTNFYKVRPNEAVNLQGLLDKIAEGISSQESDYIVVKEVNLSDADYENLTQDLTKPQDFLQDLESVDRKNYAFNVVKVTSDGKQTLLIDPVGYKYPRYIGLLSE